MIYLNRSPGKTFVVKQGYVRLVYAEPNGRLLTRMLLGRGALFGDLPFRPEVFHSIERAIASGMTSVIELARDELEEHARSNAHFQSLLLQTFSAQLSALDRRLQWQLVSPIRTRIAAALLDLICFAGGRCGHGHLIDIRLTHEELAELVISARPVVSEVLSELKSQRIVEYTRAHICLLNLDRLKAISEAAE
jgi:CRP/FNR family transcriptional regulator